LEKYELVILEERVKKKRKGKKTKMRKRKRKERGRREELPVFVPATQC
jgi:hypothetical protein